MTVLQAEITAVLQRAPAGLKFRDLCAQVSGSRGEIIQALTRLRELRLVDITKGEVPRTFFLRKDTVPR